MPFKYNPPTRTKCQLCEDLHERDRVQPIIDSHKGKASSANNFQFHNWYNFVLGYSPQFPQYMLQRENISAEDCVADPFMGSGTTLVACKTFGIPSIGVDANDFMVSAAKTKLNWMVDAGMVRKYARHVLSCVEKELAAYNWLSNHHGLASAQLSIFQTSDDPLPYLPLVQARRPKMLLEKYISDKPLAKAYIIQDVIEAEVKDQSIKEIFDLALLSIILPSSNVRYGPGFGIIKPKDDVNVFRLFSMKLNSMISDLEHISQSQRKAPSQVHLGDARKLSSYIDPESVKLMITSPPYPGDHEYTKHTRLELIFKGYATNIDEFRLIKKRMLRGSTTNIYADDNDRLLINHLESVKAVTTLIDERLRADGATSGFEKLYTKLVWEYFGGMHKTLVECLKVLQPGGKIALLVSDSHAFKMVHIQTAEILREVGELAGFVNPEIRLWQFKTTTSHSYSLRENVLILTKPA